MDESSELEVQTSNDQGVGSSAPSDARMDEELDGLPVFGTDDDDWEMDSTFSQRVFSQLDRNSDDEDKNDSRDGAPTTVANADENSSSTIGSSEVDEERTKVSEENPLTPSSDAIIDIPETQSQVDTRTPQRDANLQKEPPGQDKETHFPPVIQIKDEPIDEDYDKALIPQSDTSNVKQEITENEATSLSDELRISSVFSVSGNNSDAVSAPVATVQQSSFPVMSQSTSLRGTLILPTQAQPQFQLRIQPRPQMQPQIRTQTAILSHAPIQPPAPSVHAPPPAVRICCSGCSKILQKGQTAFQRKGSNQLFCSTVCLTSFSLPSVQFTPIIAPRKTCNLCLKVIVNLKDLITIPVGSMNTLKEFCSLACLNIYKDRYENAPPDMFTQCNVCKLVREIQHEVTHLGVVHKLCSDECFARFRSSRNLYMSYCENCGNCNASGNYHLVQIEDGIKKFCTTDCITTFKQKSGKRLSCPYCQEFKNVDQMIDGTNIQGVTEFFCSQRCVALSQASPSLTGTSFPCTSCKKLAIPQYHLAIADGSIRNFCSLDCVGKFQDKMNTSVPHNQINGNSHGAQNAPSEQPTVQHAPTQTSSSNLSGQSQNSVPSHAPAPGPVNSQETVQKATKSIPSAYKKELECMQCRVLFQDKPQVFQCKGLSGAFCTRACCDAYKREHNVTAFCEYCKQEKVVKDAITYEKQLRYFCCEGCKLLFKHDLTKRQGVQFRFCAYCQNMTHKTVQNFFGGKLEEFCTEDCMSQYTVLFYEMAKCYNCKQQGPLKESLVLYGSKKHFCNMNCLRNFCSRTLMYRQSRNSTLTNLTTVQAPLSISKDMPVIGGVVSLASTLPGNTAVTGALPTSNANSKNIGEASTQTDAAVPGTPHRRTLKNKALMCRPITEEQGVQCQRDPPTARPLSETVIDENGEKVRLVPFPVPIPVPVYIPVPMHLYTQYTPFPLGLPLPVPVPVVIPGSQDADEPEERKTSLPAQSSMEDDEGDKGKGKPVSHDQGSTYSGDLESEATSTPFSWAENEEPGVSGKQLVPSSELEDPQVAASTVSPEHPDLEDDFPRALVDPGSAKESRLVLTLKRRRKGRDSCPAKKRAAETATEGLVDCKDADEKQTKTFVDSACQTSRPLTGRSHPNLKITSPSKQQLKYLMNQSRGRPDRYGCLLLRAVLPKQLYAEWVSTTNWDGARGKLALPVNLRHFIIKTVSEKFPSLTSGDRKRIKDRINEFLRSPRIGVGRGRLQSNSKAVETITEAVETITEESMTQPDFEDVEMKKIRSSVNSPGNTSTAPVVRCHPHLKFNSPSMVQRKILMNQSRGRPDRYGCLLFRAVLPKHLYAEWASTTNWDGARGKLALPVNLRHFIIKTALEKFPSLTSSDRKRIKDRINEFLRSPRIGVGRGRLQSNSKAAMTTTEAAEMTTVAVETITEQTETITEETGTTTEVPDATTEAPETTTEAPRTQLDCEDTDEKQKTSSDDSLGQYLITPILCHPNFEITSPSKKQLKRLMIQSRGRADRYGCLLFRAVLPEKLYAVWALTTNWNGARGKYALPLNLRQFIIESVCQKFPNLTRVDRKHIKDRINEFLRSPRNGVGTESLRSKGRKRSGTDTSSSVWLSTSSSKLNQVYGVTAWTSWVKSKKGPTSDEGEQQSPGRMVMKEDVLQCSSAELGYGLCRFIKEVRRPNGKVYEPDSVYYLCLGIQQCLLEKGRLENIFTDSLYIEFISEITTLLKDWANTLPLGGYMNSRVEEEYLWECKQLGALSPIVLLNTLLFFGAKILNLKTVEQHQRLTFSNVTQCSKTIKNGVTSYLRFKLPNKEESTEKRAVKRKREEETVDEQFMEMPENSENPLRCPVRLYQFYLSKCSDTVKQRPDLFYLQPETSCHPSSPVWYSAQPLDTAMMEGMLTRIVVVRDIHLDSTQQKYPDSSDEESSQ
ncbi:zinc finger MYM-type protein 4 isoform X2 [Triplophysa rosa]|uniref:zinc finger MYM-type protein 4 isoform X2 n=1 Tax=Triplophysa rosa TaxID=992332 RepID=UPI0025461847|nr:zinc finger MYM-type protein 4 isoform X2 [Triplophysa rosa]